MESATAPGLFKTFVARGLHWPLLVVALLLVPVVAGGYLAYMATHDPTFAIESDYYRKAVAWDATMAQEQANAKLGWQSVVTATPVGSALDVAVQVQDKAANLAGLTVQVEGFFLARSKDVQSAAAVLAADGRYHVTLPFGHRGVHEIRVRAQRGADTFTATHRIDVAR